MTTVVLFDPEAAIPAQVRWALWFARAAQAPLVVLLSKQAGERMISRVRGELRTQLAAHPEYRLRRDDEHDGADAGTKAAQSPGDAGKTADEQSGESAKLVQLDSVPIDDPVAMSECLAEHQPDRVVVLRQRFDAGDEVATKLGRDLLPKLSCAVAVVRLGAAEATAWPPRRMLVAVDSGAHTRHALAFTAAAPLQAASAAPSDEGKLIAVYVEPDIGSDAKDVGRKVLERNVRRALGEQARAAEPIVVIADDVDCGLAQVAEQVNAEVLLLGVVGAGLLGNRFHGTTAARLARRTELPVVLLREPLPLGNRMRRLAEKWLVRFVPQVERDTRVALAERVQSSSAWNFDFGALLSLATAIAALGLLQNSAAVIIGAMLIAPLMTPILGVGLALAQGNRRLLLLAARSIGLGVATAFVLALGIGALLGMGAAAPPATSEMLSRGWPGVTDLLVAFVSGLAAAYAHSRPGLVAALPGVAIAAALVPPIATAGLAMAAGNFELGFGALLLFVVNMVAIVLAAGTSLWAVGVRPQQQHGWLRVVGYTLFAAVLVLTVHLSQRAHLGAEVGVPASVRAAAGRMLPAGLQLSALAAEQAAGHLVVRVTVAGAAPPPPMLAQQLRDGLAALLPQPLRLDLDFAWRASVGAGVTTGR